MSAENGGFDGLPPLDRNNGQDTQPVSGAGGGSADSAASNPWNVPASDSTPTFARSQPSTSSPGSPNSSTPSGSASQGGARKPVLRYVPGQDSPRASSPGAPEPDEDRTTELPAGYFGRMAPPPLLPGRRVRSARSARSQGPLVVVLSILIVLAVLAALLISPLRSYLQTSSVPVIGGCGNGSACQAASAYLADYASGNYEAMYGHLSAASRTKFSSADILGSSYKDAHDYIVNRTSAIIAQAQVTTIQTTVGATSMQGDSNATVAAHVVMTSARVDPIIQDLSIPVTKESGKWMVSWSPGLIFKQLDDPSDPTYQHLVRLNATVGTRGTIFDAGGDALAKDDTVYDVDVDTSKIANESSLDNALATDLTMTAAQVKAAYNAGTPVRTITGDYYNTIKDALGKLPGVYTAQRTARVYPNGADLAAVTGYVSTVTTDDLKGDTSHYYCAADDPNTCGAGDVAGHAGVEAWGEQYLRPVKGGTLVIVARNADGSPTSQPLVTLGTRQAANGADIHTTISLKDQLGATSTLAGFAQFETGAGAVAVNPLTGEVLVMASFPSCDPNNFSLNFAPGVDACKNTSGALLNHALQSAQPTGSVFKVITLSAALEHGISAGQSFTCNGSYLVPGETAARQDDVVGGHGTLTGPNAIGPSCDVIFWQIGVQLNKSDPTILPNTAKAFGFGAPTNIVGMPSDEEVAGNVPDKDTSPAAAANLAIGQGDFLATPAQIAMAAAALANSGIRMQPRLVTSVVGPDGAQLATFPQKQIGTLPLSTQNLQTVQVAMLGTTTAPSGTAYRDFTEVPVLVAGKTGTAENGSPRPHGWFMAYAPASPISGPAVTPQIAIGVLHEYMNNGTWAECYAVPTTLNILRAQMNLGGHTFGTHC